MTAQDILTELDEALKEFGTYSFDDKGPEEVMNLDGIVNTLNAMDVKEVVDILETVSAASDRAKTLVEHLLMDMQDIPDERWDALMESPKLASMF